MGFLDNLRKSKDADIHQDWKVLDSIEQLEKVIEASKDKPVVIFKHSTTCGISARAKHGLESEWDFDANDFDFYYLDLLSYRPVSNKVAEVLNVIHQSPQIVVVKNGKAVFNNSHHAISVDSLKKNLS